MLALRTRQRHRILVFFRILKVLTAFWARVAPFQRVDLLLKLSLGLIARRYLFNDTRGVGPDARQHRCQHDVDILLDSFPFLRIRIERCPLLLLGYLQAFRSCKELLVLICIQNFDGIRGPISFQLLCALLGFQALKKLPAISNISYVVTIEVSRTSARPCKADTQLRTLVSVSATKNLQRMHTAKCQTIEAEFVVTKVKSFFISAHVDLNLWPQP